MTAREPAPHQPKNFAFDAKHKKRIKEILACYPKTRKQSAMIPLLDLAQRQVGESEGGGYGWVPIAAMDHIAELLEVAPIRVYEVASFYSMFNLKPIGKHFVQVCRTTPCWLRGSDAITQACLHKAGTKKLGETGADGDFTVVEVECLGACVNAPMVQINDDYFEDVTPERVEELMQMIKDGKKPPVGTQVKRLNSAPVEE